MPDLVVYVSGSPFKRTRRAEYRYTPVSVEAEEPIAPLLEPEVYDAHGLVLVADVYSVWPEVGGHRATSYREMLHVLEAYMGRSCGRRLPVRLCGRVTYRVHPWMGEAGGWRLNGSPGDAALYAVLHVAHALLGQLEAPRGRRPRRIYSVYTEEQHPWQARVQELAAQLAAAALQAELVEAVQWPQPYPRGRTPPLIDTVEHRRLAPATALARLLAEPRPRPGPLLSPRGPHAPRPPRRAEEAAQLSAAAALMARGCMATALAAAAAAAENPLERLASALREAALAYEEATRLSKKRAGGMVAHSLEAGYDAVAAAAAGAAAMQAVLERLSMLGWEPREPLTPRQLGAVLELLGCGRDETPESCTERSPGGRLWLRPGCLRRLREAVLGGSEATAP